MFKFSNEADATAWFNDPEYQALSLYRRADSKWKFLNMMNAIPARRGHRSQLYI